MGFLAEIFGIGASVASGGLFGLLGSIVGAGSKYLQEKQRQAWQRQKWAYETELLKLQMEAKALETERELAIVSQQGAWDGLTWSTDAEMSVRNVHTLGKRSQGSVPAMLDPVSLGDCIDPVFCRCLGPARRLDFGRRTDRADSLYGLHRILLRFDGDRLVVRRPGADAARFQEPLDASAIAAIAAIANRALRS